MPSRARSTARWADRTFSLHRSRFVREKLATRLAGKPDDDPSTWRRSLYVFSKRSIRYPLFETFDQPNLINSVDRRNRSTVAPQALIVMNNPTVLFQAKKFADCISAEAGGDPERQVAHAFRHALGRAPTREALAESVRFVRADADGLAQFCHLLFNLIEFVYRP